MRKILTLALLFTALPAAVLAQTHTEMTLEDNQTAAGNKTFSGQNVIASYSIDNVQYVDGIKYPCSDVGLNAALAAGTSSQVIVDARGCQGTNTIASTVTVGGTNKVATLLLDRGSRWDCTITNGTACWQLSMGGSAIEVPGRTSPGATQSGFTVSNSANISNVILLVNTGGGASNYALDGITIQGNSSATVTDSVISLMNTLQASNVDALSVLGFSNTYLLKITQTGINPIGQTNFYNPQLNCENVTGCKPLIIKNAIGSTGLIGGLDFYGGSYTHPGSGGNAIIDIEGNAGSLIDNINFYGPQIESNSSGDIGVLVNNAFGVYLGSPLFTAETTAGTACIKITGRSGLFTAENITNFNGWTDTIMNSATGGTTITAATQERINHYSYSGIGAPGTTLENVFEDTSGREAVIDTNGVTAHALVATGTQSVTGSAGCGRLSSKAGGAWAGSLAIGTFSSNCVLTITPGITAPHGWACTVSNETHPTELFNQTSHSQTACVLTSITATTGDALTWIAIAF